MHAVPQGHGLRALGSSSIAAARSNAAGPDGMVATEKVNLCDQNLVV